MDSELTGERITRISFLASKTQRGFLFRLSEAPNNKIKYSARGKFLKSTEAARADRQEIFVKGGFFWVLSLPIQEKYLGSGAKPHNTEKTLDPRVKPTVGGTEPPEDDNFIEIFLTLYECTSL